MSHSRHLPAGLAEAFRRVAAGDRAAFGDVYDALAPTVLGVGLRVTATRALAESITQDVFVELWRHAPAILRSRETLDHWAVRTTLRLAGAATPSPSASPLGEAACA